MHLKMIPLAALRESAGDDAAEFAKRYPGAFLVAVGFIAPKDGDDESLIPDDEPEQQGEGGPLKPRSTVEVASVSMPSATGAMNLGRDPSHAMRPHPLAGRTYFLRSGDEGAVLGRSPQSSLTVPDVSVSAQHCEVRVDGSLLKVRDLDSTNGTWVDKRRLESGDAGALIDEGLICVGRYAFQFYLALSMHRVLKVLADLPE